MAVSSHPSVSLSRACALLHFRYKFWEHVKTSWGKELFLIQEKGVHKWNAVKSCRHGSALFLWRPSLEMGRADKERQESTRNRAGCKVNRTRELTSCHFRLCRPRRKRAATPSLHGTLDVSQGMTIWLCLFCSGGRGTVYFLKTIKSF